MTDETDHPSVARVRQALRDAGAATASIDGLRVLPDAVTTAKAAAEAVGVETGQIANSLVFDADGEPLLVLTSGAHRVDTDKVAALLGIGALGRASKEFVREATGQVIGGVAPVGHPAPLRTLVDTALAEFDVVWAAGGVARAVFGDDVRRAGARHRRDARRRGVTRRCRPIDDLNLVWGNGRPAGSHRARRSRRHFGARAQ